jgi:hypothetical protein
LRAFFEKKKIAVDMRSSHAIAVLFFYDRGWLYEKMAGLSFFTLLFLYPLPCYGGSTLLRRLRKGGIMLFPFLKPFTKPLRRLARKVCRRPERYTARLPLILFFLNPNKKQKAFPDRNKTYREMPFVGKKLLCISLPPIFIKRTIERGERTRIGKQILEKACFPEF